jgi:dTDP-4-amino-4,6-dideoxygalactose transaminase
MLVEDAAEAIGSYTGEDHLGTIGDIGVLSFNGNKTITTGCGGMVLTKNEVLIEKIHHLSTTAKKSHPWEFDHDQIGYNYRMSNVTAAIGLAQMEVLDRILDSKRTTAMLYMDFFKSKGVRFLSETPGTQSNYWLNGIAIDDPEEHLAFLTFMNEHAVNCRPIWKGMHELSIYEHCFKSDLRITEDLCRSVINLPSGFR